MFMYSSKPRILPSSLIFTLSQSQIYTLDLLCKKRKITARGLILFGCAFFDIYKRIYYINPNPPNTYSNPNAQLINNRRSSIVPAMNMIYYWINMLLKSIWRQLAFKSPSFPPTLAITTAPHRPTLHKQTFCFSQEEREPHHQQSNPRKYQKNKQKPQQGNPTTENTQNQKPDLTRLIRAHRTRMDQGGTLSDYAYGCKKIASYYRKTVHHEFTALKQQLELTLEGLNNFSLTHLKLEDYFHLLDFLRITARVESISRPVQQKAKDTLASHLKEYLQKLADLKTEQLLPLYCRIGPFNLTSAFKITMVLHDRLADLFNEQGKLDFPMIQIYTLIKSLGQRGFLSFPDKKILEMFLLTLKAQLKTIDNIMMLKLAIALKNCNLKANISDREIYEISDQIQRKAVELVRKGIKFEWFEYILHNDPTDNPYFMEIYQIFYDKTILKFHNPQEGPLRLSNLRILSLIVKHIRHYYPFPPTDTAAVLQYLNSLLDQPIETLDKKEFNLVLLDLLRDNFFSKHLDELTAILRKSKAEIYWSFPLEYSYRNITFPADLIATKIKSFTHHFSFEHNYLKMAVTVAHQSRLNPTNDVLTQCHQLIIQDLRSKNWQAKQTEWLIRLSLNDPELVRQYHLLYSQHYISGMLPSVQQIKRDNQLQRGEKSQIYKFWEYLLLAYNYDTQLPHQLIQQVPDYAVYLVANREVNTQNVAPHPKKLLLLALHLKLASEKMKFNMNDGNIICDLLLRYVALLDNHDESFLELYFHNVLQCLSHYQRLHKSLLTSFNFLITRLLTLNNPKLTHSHYYHHFVNELLHHKVIVDLQSSYDYLKTSIVRAALHLNLISPHSLAKIQWKFFTKHEQKMMQALTQQFQLQQWKVESLVSYLKIARPSSTNTEEVTQINALIDASNTLDLQRYLIHFSMARTTHSDNILLRIVQRFIPLMQVKDLNIIAVLSNIKTPLRKIDDKLFQELVLAVCEQLTNDPTTHFLADHLHLLRLLTESGINCAKYEQMLAKYVQETPHKGAVCIEVVYELSRKGLIITNDHFELVRNYFIINPETSLKIALLNEDSIVNSKQFCKTVVSNLPKPLKPSLYTLFLQKNASLLFAKQKNNDPLLHKPNAPSAQFLKSLQTHDIDIAHEQKSGEHIYLIKDKIALVFTEINYHRQNQFIHRTLQFLYPTRSILTVRKHAGLTDIRALLETLRSHHSTDSNRVRLISEDVCNKIQEELHLT